MAGKHYLGISERNLIAFPCASKKKTRSGAFAGGCVLVFLRRHTHCGFSPVMKVYLQRRPDKPNRLVTETYKITVGVNGNVIGQTLKWNPDG